MPVAADLIALLDEWVAEGIREVPGGSNHGEPRCICEEFGPIGSTTHYAWCASTVTLAIGATFGHELFRSAAVSQWIAAAKAGKAGLGWLPVSDDPWIEPGMLATFDFGPANGKAPGNSSNFHISTVRDAGTQGTFQTDGGNEGDAMRQQWRNRKYVQGFISLPFDSSPVPPDPTPIPTPVPLEDDMTPYACQTSDGVYHSFAVKADGRIYETTWQAGQDDWSQPVLVLNGEAQALARGGVGGICAGTRIDLFVIGPADAKQWHGYRLKGDGEWVWRTLPGDYS